MAWDSASDILSNATITASGQSTAIDPEGADVVRGIVVFNLSVGVVTGTSPTLVISVEESSDNTNWYQVVGIVWNLASGTSNQLITATKTTTNQYLAVGVVQHRYLRARYVVGGTGSPTFNTVYLHSRALGHMVALPPSAT